MIVSLDSLKDLPDGRANIADNQKDVNDALISKVVTNKREDNTLFADIAIVAVDEYKNIANLSDDYILDVRM